MDGIEILLLPLRYLLLRINKGYKNLKPNLSVNFNNIVVIPKKCNTYLANNYIFLTSF